MNDSAPTDDRIWKALADGTRRQILDVLAERPLTTGELVARFDHLCRTNVMKHVDVLVKVNLIVVRREGRTRWNQLNPAPIQSVCDRWVSRHVQNMASSMSRLKKHAEEKSKNEKTRKANSAKKTSAKTTNKQKAKEKK